MQSPQRKVGQDMVKKQPSEKKRVVVRASEPRKPEIVKTIPQRVVSQKKVVQKAEVPIQKNKAPSEFPSLYDRFEKRIPTQPSLKKPAKGGIMWIFSVILFLVCGLSIASYFAQANITLTFEQKELPVNLETELFSEPTENQLGYKTVEIVDQQTYFFSSTEKREVQDHAVGTVKLFNKTNQQITIPTGTMMASSSGTQFATQSQVIIPKGTEQLPGTKEVQVKAVQAGQQANISMDDFTVSGFPSIIARSITEIGGGFSGTVGVISETELQAVQTTLTDRMNRQQGELYLVNQIPEGFLLPKEFIIVGNIEFTQHPSEQGVEVIAKRKIIGHLLSIENFHHYLLTQALPNDQVDIFVVNQEKSKIAYTINFDNEKKYAVIQGTVLAQTIIQEQEIINKLRGQKVKQISELLQNTTGLIHHSVTITPFWIGKIPQKLQQINLDIQYLTK